jgi:hypothetical protein
MTNDLMHGVFTTKYMANHSLTGGGEKPPLPEKVVNLIIGKKFFCYVSKTFKIQPIMQ